MVGQVLGQPAWNRLLRWLANISSELRGQQPWYVEAHQFRIDTTDGIGRPTPEGAHRGGVDLVAVFLVAREGVKGGETRVFEAAGPAGQRFTLSAPWSLLLLDDARMIHETTPIQPLVAGAGKVLEVAQLAGGADAAEDDVVAVFGAKQRQLQPLAPGGVGRPPAQPGLQAGGAHLLQVGVALQPGGQAAGLVGGGAAQPGGGGDAGVARGVRGQREPGNPLPGPPRGRGWSRQRPRSDR